MDGPVPVVLESEGQSAHPEKEVFDMKKALAGLLIFGMVGAAMVVPAAAAGHHGGGHGGGIGLYRRSDRRQKRVLRDSRQHVRAGSG